MNSYNKNDLAQLAEVKTTQSTPLSSSQWAKAHLSLDRKCMASVSD